MKNNKFSELWNKGAVRIATFAIVFVVAVASIIMLAGRSDDEKVPPIDYGENNGQTPDGTEQDMAGENKPDDEQIADNKEPDAEGNKEQVSDKTDTEQPDKEQIADNKEQNGTTDKEQGTADVEDGKQEVADTEQPDKEQIADNDKTDTEQPDKEQIADNEGEDITDVMENKDGVAIQQTAEVIEPEKEPDALEVMQNTIKNLTFNETEGLMWPVRGAILLNYSVEHLVYHKTLDQFRTNPAVLIGAEAGTQVTAAATGVITSIEKTYKTGWTVTTAVGNGYSIVYGQLEEVPYKVGDVVKEGTVIATLAQPSKVYAKEGNGLYFQVLNNGESVNPMLLLGE